MTNGNDAKTGALDFSHAITPVVLAVIFHCQLTESFGDDIARREFHFAE